jgi:pimeloyl-ACP methyl ester carboxylesterase
MRPAIGFSTNKPFLKYFFAVIALATALCLASQELESLAGTWVGDLKVQNSSLPIVFTIKVEKGKASGAMDSPNTGIKNFAASSITLEAGTLTIEFKAAAAAYIGTLGPEGKSVTGLWKQGGAEFLFDLVKSDGPFVQDRPQEPKAPFPYKSEEVWFTNWKAWAKLAGTLVLPEGKGPFPAVVLVSGSGPQDRNEELMGHKPFLIIADYLARRGIASLRYDDRGTAASGGKFAKATTMDFADDAQTALSFLAKRKEIDPKRIGIVGHSEGGMIAPLVAGRDSRVAFVVLLAGPGLRGAEILRLQGTLIARAMGQPEEEIAKGLALNAELYALAEGGLPDAAVKAQAKAIYFASLDADAAMTPEQKDQAKKGTEQMAASLVSPWFRSFLRFDPIPHLSALRIPVLALNGSKDLQVPADENLASIKAALGPAMDLRSRIVELEGLNHLFQHAGSGSPTEYGAIAETFAPEALEAVGDWILSL